VLDDTGFFGPYQYQLWVLWLALGLLLLALVAAVLRLSSSSSRARSRRQHEEGGSGATPRVTIFSAPRLTPEGSQARQELAVRSWLALPGNVSVVLLGAHASSLAVAGRLGRRVTVDAAIDSSYAFPTPLNVIISRNTSSPQPDSSEISVALWS